MKYGRVRCKLSDPDIEIKLTAVINNDTILNLDEILLERFYNIYQFKDLIDRKVVSLVRPDLSLAGGFTQVKKIAAIAEPAFVGIFPHLMGSPVNNSAFAHLAAAIPNYTHTEHNALTGPMAEIVDGQMPAETVQGMVSSQEEGVLGQGKSGRVLLFRMVLKDGGMGGERWWEPRQKL